MCVCEGTVPYFPNKLGSFKKMLQGAAGRDGNYFLLSRLVASSVNSRRSPRLHIEMRSTTLRVAGGVGNRMLRLRTEEKRERGRLRGRGAGGRNRTADTGIFSPLLYRLSYPGSRKGLYSTRSRSPCKMDPTGRLPQKIRPNGERNLLSVLAAALHPGVPGTRLRGGQICPPPSFSMKRAGPRRGEFPGPSGKGLQLTRTAICLGFAGFSLEMEMLRTPFFSSAETFSRFSPRGGSRKERWNRPCHLWT